MAHFASAGLFCSLDAFLNAVDGEDVDADAEVADPRDAADDDSDRGLIHPARVARIAVAVAVTRSFSSLIKARFAAAGT